ncbi:MAG: AsmA-like C-terminal domain-containing protein [Candidatus Binatia bacterium]
MRRLIVVLGVFVVLILVICVGSALILPRLIDSQLVRDKISAGLAKKIAGTVTFDKIALAWFPRPSVAMENAAFSFNDGTQASIQTATIYPSILDLLTGHLVARRVLLQAVQVRIHLPESSDKRFELQELEKTIRSALVRLTTELPAPRIDVADGSAEIRIGDKPPVLLENIAGHAVGSAADLRFEVSARSNLCERLRIEGKISPESLAAQLQVGVQRLKVKESLIFLPLQISEYARQGEASLDLNIAAVGLQKVRATITGSIGPLVFARHSGTATVEAKRLKGGMTYEGGALQVDVEELDLGSPRLKASGELKAHSGSLSARIRVRDVDIAEVSDLAFRIADDPEAVKRMLRYIPAGTIREMNVQSAGRSFTEMALSKNIVVSGVVHNCNIFIPGADLELASVTGSVRISDGILEAGNVSGNLGTARGRSGNLKLGLDGKTAPFHFDMSVHTGAPELQAVLLKLVHDETFRRELLKVRNVSGELSGRLILGGTLDAVSPVVTVSKADIGATYEPIPFPIAIRGARFNYDQRTIRLENAQGSVGRSTFAGLGVTLHQDGSRRIEVDSGRVSLDLQQTDTLVRGFKDLRSPFEKLQSVRGQVELQNLALTGTYDDPAGWIFASAGRFDQIEITHGDFPGRMALSGGRFNAKQGQILFYDASAAMSDASLIASGTFEYQKGAPFRIETRGMATVGAQMTEWLSHHVELPKEMKLRSPLKIAAERLAWRAGADASFRGQVTVSEGPRFAVDVVKQPQALTLRNLTIDDGERHARIMVQFAKDKLDLSFSGELMQETIDKVFASFPMQHGSLRGDIQISASLATPMTIAARGALDGSDLWIPLGAEKTRFEKFSLEASGDSVLVRSADLLWGKSRLAVSGKVAGAKGILRVDLDVTGDRLDWEELQRSFGSGGEQRQSKNNGILSIPDVEGTIRLKIDRFAFDRFNVSTLETTAAISRSGISADIDRAIVCGITVTGRVDVAAREIGLDLQLTASEAQLEPATVCLTNQQSEVKGRYSLSARLAARGAQGRLLRSLKGNFELNAHDGEFIRAPGIDATFDYLNATGDFRVAFPDLDRETFPYRFVGVKGRIEGKMLVGDEVHIESFLLNLSGQGKVDLELEQIDGKGLIVVLKPLDDVIARIPVIGSMLGGGGSLVGIPVRVTGPLDRPDVTYLSPADVGVELLNIPLRILKMPLGAMRLFTPSEDLRDKRMIK